MAREKKKRRRKRKGKNRKKKGRRGQARRRRKQKGREGREETWSIKEQMIFKKPDLDDSSEIKLSVRQFS